LTKTSLRPCDKRTLGKVRRIHLIQVFLETYRNGSALVLSVIDILCSKSALALESYSLAKKRRCQVGRALEWRC
jgi:hypothetical protein